MSLEARRPVLGVLRVAPAGSLLFEHSRGGDGEGRDAMGPALLGQRVAAGACESAVGQGLFSRLLQRHQREAAESELAPPASDHEPLKPPPPSGRLDLEVEAVAVTVPAGLGDLTDEGGRESILGMRFARFLSLLFLLVWHDPPFTPPFNGGCLGIIPNCLGLVKTRVTLG